MYCLRDTQDGKQHGGDDHVGGAGHEEEPYAEITAKATPYSKRSSRVQP